VTLPDLATFADGVLFVGVCVMLFGLGWIAGANDGRGLG